ncbi:inner membrane protein OXA1-like [Euphorbia peplus]|nr:inner membrane protein OXA1-like [Euphorbia peplus]
MAFIRSRANLLTRRCHSSLAYILHHHRGHDHPDYSTHKQPFSQQRNAFGTTTGFTRSSSLLRGSRCFDFSVSPTFQASFSRHMSTSNGEEADGIEMMSDVAELLSDSTLQSVASQASAAVNEVAIAAADSVFPVAQLQHFIDAVHSFTGFNWWASIALTTLVVKGATLPLMLNQLKVFSRLNVMMPHLKEIQQKVRDGGLHMYEGRKQILMLLKEYNATPFAIIMRLFIQFPVFICFFLALSNMAEKVPSFKSGGAFWFLDLSTPDNLYVFPLLTALTFWIIVEVKMQKDLKGNAPGRITKKAIFCYWITSHIFHLAYSLGVKLPRVKKFLGLPETSQKIRSQVKENRANLLTRRCHSSLAYILHHHRDHHHRDDSTHKPPFSQHRSAFGTTTGFTRSSSLLRGSRCFDFSVSPTFQASFSRHMSTSTGEEADGIEMTSDVAELLSNSSLQSVASQASPAVKEVAIAAADSVFPIAQVQHFIDAVHSYTGFNWWISIVLSTLLVRGAVVPLMINIDKAYLQVMPRARIIKQRLEEQLLKFDDKGFNAHVSKQEVTFKEWAVLLIVPMKRLLIKFPIFVCFSLAILNMAEKVPSFKTGGAFWFLNLSTPDTQYIFPVLTALTYLMSKAIHYPLFNKDLKGPDGNIKNAIWGFAVLSVPLTMGLPKAIFFYWITSNIFTFVYDIAIRLPRVKKILGFSEIGSKENKKI